MKNDKIKIIDSSGDRKYFTILPNFILNHSTGNEQALYAQMKRFAGENGKCFATQISLGKKLGWGRTKVSKIINKLVRREWIELVGTKIFKTSPVNVYRVVNLWRTNTDFYNKKRCAEKEHLSKKVKRDVPKTVIRDVPKTVIEEERIIKEELEEREKTPSQEMKSFLKDNSFFNEIVAEFSKKNKMESSEVILQAQRFRSYWSELNASGKKQKWQLEKTFELKRRFGTWMRRAESFGDFKGKVAVKKY